MREERQPATESDIRWVLNNLWPRGIEELERLGLSKEEAIKRFVGYAKTDFVGGTYLVDEIPIFTCGINKDGFTWFIATEDFEKYALEATRILKRYIKQYPGEVYLYSTLVHPEAAKWYRILSFVQDKNFHGITKAGYPLFKFQKKEKKDERVVCERSEPI